MFGTNHYIPILRWKQAERFALHRLRSDDRSRVTPLIEITPKSFRPKRRGKGETEDSGPETLVAQDSSPDPGSILRRHAKEVLRFWGYAPFFLDLQHIESFVPSINGSVHAMTYFAELGRSYRLSVVPVTSLERPPRYHDAVTGAIRADGNGVCVRVSVSDILTETFVERLRECLGKMNVSADKTDLLLDYGVFDPDAPRIADLLTRIPQLNSWRSLIVARGAFPKDLQGFKPGTHKIVRHDWANWRKESLDHRRLRWPSFSDYTVQYGQYVEPVDNANPSASIRYTLAEDWLIMRGEGIFNEDGPGRAQWNANAILLSEHDEFYGPDFSDGDSYILEMSRREKEHGSPMTWIRAGLNHHMSVVARQIAAL